MEYKGYKLEREPNYFMVEIKAIGRGSVHMSLRGYYQTYKDAMRAIDHFESKFDKRKGDSDA
jgi:hypothetical protein